MRWAEPMTRLCWYCWVLRRGWSAGVPGRRGRLARAA